MAHSLQHPLNSASSEPKAGIINGALVVSIVGPTASGKSALAQSVALELDGEVVSADSMQIYRFMDIGTAKLKPEERLVKHHLLDIVDPGQSYSAQLFKIRHAQHSGTSPHAIRFLSFQAVQDSMSRLHSKTCVFLKANKMITHCALIMKLFRLNREMKPYGTMLNEKDPASAKLIHPNNFKRVIRALEMHEEGVSYADQVKNIRSLPESNTFHTGSSLRLTIHPC